MLKLFFNLGSFDDKAQEEEDKKDGILEDDITVASFREETSLEAALSTKLNKIEVLFSFGFFIKTLFLRNYWRIFLNAKSSLNNSFEIVRSISIAQFFSAVRCDKTFEIKVYLNRASRDDAFRAFVNFSQRSFRHNSKSLVLFTKNSTSHSRGKEINIALQFSRQEDTA